jgi:hypothetical protein
MKVPTDVALQVRADRSSGMSVKEISAKHGLHRSTISKLMSNVEVETRVDIPVVVANLAERAKVFEDVPLERVAEQKPKDMKALSKMFAAMKEDVAVVPQEIVVRDLPRGDPAELIQKILFNAESFPEVFPNPPTHTTLANKSLKELSEVLSSMEMSRAVRMLTIQMKQMFFVGSRATEVVGKVMRLKVDGLTDALMTQQKELDYLFKELAIKHAKSFGKTTEPEIRLLMVFGMAILQTDATNRLRERTATTDETAQKYSDL